MLHPTICVMQDNVQVMQDLLSKIDHLLTYVCNNPEDARSVLEHLVGMKRDLGILQEGHEVRCASQAWVHWAVRTCMHVLMCLLLHNWQTAIMSEKQHRLQHMSRKILTCAPARAALS